MKAARILAIIFNKAKRLDTSKELTDVGKISSFKLIFFSWIIRNSIQKDSAKSYRHNIKQPQGHQVQTGAFAGTRRTFILYFLPRMSHRQIVGLLVGALAGLCAHD